MTRATGHPALRRAAVLLAAAALAAALAAAPAARAADSLAPPGAKRTWLPKVDWVLDHQMPYDEARLLAALHVSREQVRRYFGGPRFERVPTLAALARRRGIDPGRLARRLVDAWAAHAPAARRRTLLERARRTLSQGHLMQHLMFHPFHVRALTRASPSLFGVRLSEVNAALRSGRSRAQVAAAHGRSRADIERAVAGVLRATEDAAVRRGLTPRAEADREVRLQLAALPTWLDETGARATNPQGDATTQLAGGSRARAASAGSLLCPLG